jgi:Leucine-rich repeat (LRR) protein
MIVALALLGARAALPWYRNEVARERVESLFGVTKGKSAPTWLASLLGSRIAGKVCNGVTIVELDSTPAGDDDLQLICKLPDLEVLSCSFTRVTDRGLQEIGSLARLRHLCLDDTRISDVGVAHLSRLERLESLSLVADDLSTASVSKLGKLAALRELRLPGKVLTDKNVLELRSLHNLQILQIDGTTTLSLTAAESLKEHIPGLSIYW